MRTAIAIASFFVFVSTQAYAQDSAKAPLSYDQWIRQYEKTSTAAVPYVSSKLAEQNAMLLAIFEVEERPRDEGQEEFQRSNYRNLTRGYEISQSGRVRSFLASARGFGGGGFEPLPEAAMAKVREFAGNLPSDHAYLPPAGRRLVVQAARTEGTTARVYDRANLPDSVLDTIAALRADDLLPWIFQIKSDRAGPMSDYPGNTSIHQTVSPDGRAAVVMGNAGFAVVDPGSGKLIREISESFAGRLLDPAFSPDGEYLVVRTTAPSVFVYETGGWRRAQFAGVPQKATAFWPNSSWNAAVIATSDGSVELCNGAQSIAQIANKSEVLSAEFSPDDSLVAVVTRPGKQEPGAHWPSITVWRADGTKVSSFRYGNFFQPTNEGKMLAWLSDGQHVLSPVKTQSSGNASLAVWSVQTGRYDTELAGCDGSINRFVVNADALKADCDGRGVYDWDLNSAVKKMTEFEASLK